MRLRIHFFHYNNCGVYKKNLKLHIFNEDCLKLQSKSKIQVGLLNFKLYITCRVTLLGRRKNPLFLVGGRQRILPPPYSTAGLIYSLVNC